MWPGLSAAQQLPTTAATDDIMKVCAGGRTIGVEGALKGELNKFFTGAAASGQAKLSDLGAIIDKLKPDGVGVEFYKLYTQCVKEQAEIKAKELNIKLTDKITNIDERVRAQPLTFRQSGLSAIVLRKVKVSDMYDTRVRIFDATCPIHIWGAMWVFPTDRLGEPVIKTKMTESGQTAKDYPFELRFNVDSKLVDDAGFETRDAMPFDVNQSDFIKYALGHPKEISIYLAFRPAFDNRDCTGSLLIDYPKRAGG